MTKALIILACLIGGILWGLAFAPDSTAVEAADIVGTLWLNGLKMTVVPLVVALLITGITQAVTAARAGRLAARSVITMMVIL